tara:strand:+ start:503 stop:1531 length:1029 start_codon:yes stop_codon:yes gene_type:complete
MNDNVPTQERTALTIDDAADALLSRWSDDENPSDVTDEATVEDSGETETSDNQLENSEDDTEVSTNEDDEDLEEEDSSEDEGEETEEEVEEQEVLELSDDTEVDIVVNGETQQASIKNLKRLYGQEASLTRKSQELATQRKQAEEAIGRSNVVLQKMLEKAQEKYKPYEDVDMLVASKTMSDEDFALLRKEASQAESELKFLREEANQFYGEIQAEQQKAMQESAKECVAVLQEKVPEWNNKMYDDIRAYAVSIGLPEEGVNQIVDPNVIMTINKARLYDQGKKVATVKRKKATKVIKSKKAPLTSKSVKAKKQEQAQKALRTSAGNDFDDIADVILGRWEQ